MDPRTVAHALSPFARETSLNISSLGLTRQVQLQQLLHSYTEESGAEIATLLDPTGAILVRAGKVEFRSLDSIAILATASFAASRSLAAQLGDATFGGICHQGRQHWLYLAPAAQDAMFLVLHPQGADLQTIRGALLKFLPRVNHILVATPSRAGSATAPTAQQVAN